jgi:hypothetical protein
VHFSPFQLAALSQICDNVSKGRETPQAQKQRTNKMTRFYTNREWAALTTAQKLAFGAGNVERITRKGYAGKTVTEWKVTLS